MTAGIVLVKIEVFELLGIKTFCLLNYFIHLKPHKCMDHVKKRRFENSRKPSS